MFDFKDKSTNLDYMNRYIYAKTLSMFDYEGLPETIPEIELEKQLQKTGSAFITEVNGELYSFTGTPSAEVDVYGNHTKIRIDNTALKLNKEYDLKRDGVLFQNDDENLGLHQIVNRYNSLLLENEITMYLDSYNTRIQSLISAGDDSTKESAELYLKKVVDGELGVIGENRLFEGIKTHNAKVQGQGSVVQLIELNQYIKANLLNELGLNANYNMKRERLNTSEVTMNDDLLRPFVDNMLTCREKAVEQLNEKYDLNVTVQFGSIWAGQNDEPESEVIEPESEVIEPESDSTDTEILVINVNTKDVEINSDEETDEESDEESDEETDEESDEESDEETDEEDSDDEEQNEV